MVEASDSPLFEVRNLTKHFLGSRRWLVGNREAPVRAVDGVSFALARGETLGLVGESGCGKSTLARLMVRLIQPTSGQVLFKGEDVTEMNAKRLRAWRRHVQIVLQDPFSSLDPKMTVRQILMEPFKVHPDLTSRQDPESRVKELLGVVGLSPKALERFPHQFSGGQQQRISIARALSVDPEVILCDEPVSALDVSVQAQVINLLKDIQGELGLSYVFISHDLSVVRGVADRVAVMYLGKLVEKGTEDEIFERPTHPYTQALLSAVPVPDPDASGRKGRRVLEGELPSSSHPPSGCRFRTRCWKSQEICALEEPSLEDRLGTGSVSACHFAAIESPADTDSRHT